MNKFFTFVVGVMFAMSANAQTSTTLWEEGITFDESWGGSFKIDKEKFANVNEGDKIVISAEPVEAKDWKWGSQVFIKTPRSGWDAIASTINVAKAADYEVKITSADVKVTDKSDEKNPVEVTTSILNELKEYGLVVQGIDAKVTKVALEAAVATSEVELTLVEGHTILASEFDQYSDDTKVKLTFANETNPYESRNNWGIGGFANSDNWNPTFMLTGADGTEFEVYVTVGDLKTAAKNGTDSYVDGQYHKGGVTFNIYNKCKLTHAYVVLKVDTPTGISNTLIVPAAKSGKTYNLAGQLVGASYKGVVVKNGKKYVQ